MDCQQDLAIGTLTITDQDCETSLLCNGNALFKNSVKIYNNLHLFNDIKTCGNIVPLKHTSSIGTCENPWMDLYATDGTLNTLNVDVLNVKYINCINNDDKNKNINHHEYKYYNIQNLFDKYNGIDINYIYDDNYCEVNINIRLLITGTIILDLSEVNLNFVNTKSSDVSLNSILCISDSKIYVNMHLPEMTTPVSINNKINILIINPNNYNVRYSRYDINNNSTEQSFNFIYIDEIKKWLLNYKL